MNEIFNHVREFGRQVGWLATVPLEPGYLVTQERVRGFCRENACGQYARHPMCPPAVGDLGSLKARLSGFGSGVLIQHRECVDVKNDPAAVQEAKNRFHHLLLKLEQQLAGLGAANCWPLIGGSCSLCGTCPAMNGSPCATPHQARTCLEAIGIDVQSLLERLGLDNRFHPDRITWTGAILW